MTTEHGSFRLVPHDVVVTTLVGMLADPAYWVVAVSPHVIEQAGSAVAVSGGILWLDSGRDSLFESTGVYAWQLSSLTSEVAIRTSADHVDVVAVAVIPKAAGNIAVLLGREDDCPVPTGDEIVVFKCDCFADRMGLVPAVLVDAIAVGDPAAATAIRANDVRNLS